MVDGGGGGEEGGASSGTTSPKNRVKFLCSYGGKILPRPADGHLKYVGGETRVIAVRRDINFSELMKKLMAEFEGNTVLKYQVMPEELDVLVSVRTDEDLKHMLDEYDRHESEGTPKLRAFLFPTNTLVPETQTTPADPHLLEQRYVDAINGAPRTNSSFRLPPINASRPAFSISASSSPKCSSPESNNLDLMPQEHFFMNGYPNRLPMVKVRSSPSLCSLGKPHHNQSNNLNNHHYYQQQQHHHYPPQPQQHHPHSHSYQSSRPPHDHHRLPTVLSMGQPDFRRSTSHGHYYSNRYNMGGIKYSYYDEQSPYGLKTYDKSDSLPQSPRSRFQE